MTERSVPPTNPKVSAGDMVLVVESDKADMDVESSELRSEG